MKRMKVYSAPTIDVVEVNLPCYMLSESAIDAALAAALYSARADIPLPAKTVIVGELSLAGEIRPVTKLKQRLKAANDLGFNRALVSEKIEGATVVESIGGMVRELFGE